MSAIFISHSSRDAKDAAEVRAYLDDNGYRSVFLDFDPEIGIPPGRNWEQELYSQLRASRALIVLCSEHSMSSDWCFAEITHARALGKHIFPIKIARCVVRSLLSDVQIIDFITNREAAFKILRRGLEIAGLDTANEFTWDHNRPPYPGLMAFQEADASIFFGRDDEIRDVLDLLNRLKTFGGARLALVIGASGSGKSSLIRAGVVPRLRRDTAGWIVLDPFRPQRRPLDELAIALANAFPGTDGNSDWKVIREQLRDTGADGLDACVRDLTISAGARDATVLLVLDQVEELLGYTPADEASSFIALIKSSLEIADSPLITLGTLRSDFLGAFQSHPIVRDLSFEDQRVGTMSVDDFLQVIEGPAAVAGIDLETGLSQVMLTDTETDDALPLLAFTLRELYERYGGDNRLEIKEYRESLGGLDGSVARAADAVYGAVPLSAEQHDELRAAFLSLVKIDEEGHYARRPANWQDLPTKIHDPLERFVKARLLVTHDGGDMNVLEVAHEALFRAWGHMQGWIEEEREFLLWRKRLDERVATWVDSDETEDALLHGALLQEAESWLERCNRLLNAVEKRFIHKSRARSRRRRWVLSAVAASIALVVAGLGAVAYIKGIDAKREALAVRAAGLLAIARSENNPLIANLILVEAQGLPVPIGGDDFALELVGQAVPLAILDSGGSEVLTAVFSDDSRRILSLGNDGVARISTADGTGSPEILQGTNSTLKSAVFGLDGTRVLSVHSDDTANIWKTNGTAPPVVLRSLPGKVSRAVFSPQGTHVVTVSNDGAAHLHVTDEDGDPVILSQERRVSSVKFSPKGKQVLMFLTDGTVRIRTVSTDSEEIVIVGRREIRDAVFSPDSKQLLAVEKNGVASLWALRGSNQAEQIKVFEGEITSAVFSPDGKHILTATENRADILLEVGSNRSSVIKLIGHEGIVTSAVFSSDGKRVLTTSEDGTARIWSAKRVQGTDVGLNFGEQGEYRILHGATERSFRDDYWVAGTLEKVGGWSERKKKFLTATFSPNDRHVLTVSEDGVAQVWATTIRAEPVILSENVGKLFLATFSFDSEQVLLVSSDTASLWTADSGDLRAEIKDKFAAAIWSRVNIALSPSGSHLLHVSTDGKSKLWSTNRSSPSTVLKTFKNTMTSASFSHNGERILTVYKDGAVLAWPSDGIGESVMIRAPGDRVTAAAYSPDDTHVLIVSEGGIARIEATDGSGEYSMVKTRGSSGSSDIIFSPDGRRIMARSFGAEIWMADGSGEPVTLDHAGDIMAGSYRDIFSYMFSPDGERVVSAGGDGTARVWSAVSGETVGFRGRQGEGLRHAIFSPNDKWLLTVSSDGSSRVWGADRGSAVIVSEGDEESVQTAIFSPNGERLLTVSQDGIARIWPQPPLIWQKLLVYLRERTTVCLTVDQRRLYLAEEPGKASLAFNECERRFKRAL